MIRAVLSATFMLAIGANAAEVGDFKTLAAQCAPGVHIKTLSAIVRHESRANPYAIGVNAKGARLTRQPGNKQEAIAVATWLKANGYSFDSGVGQINSKNMDWLGLSVADLFDPCKNLAGAARVITDCYQRAKPRYGGEQSTLHAALSCYNSGDFEAGKKSGYVQWVASNAALDVPELLPITSGNAAPIMLKASPASAPTKPRPAPTKPLTEGIGDAFSRPSAGAFAPKPAEKEQAQGALQIPKEVPVMLQSE